MIVYHFFSFVFALIYVSFDLTVIESYTAILLLQLSLLLLQIPLSCWTAIAINQVVNNRTVKYKTFSYLKYIIFFFFPYVLFKRVPWCREWEYSVASGKKLDIITNFVCFFSLSLSLSLFFYLPQRVSCYFWFELVSDWVLDFYLVSHHLTLFMVFFSLANSNEAKSVENYRCSHTCIHFNFWSLPKSTLTNMRFTKYRIIGIDTNIYE